MADLKAETNNDILRAKAPINISKTGPSGSQLTSLPAIYHISQNSIRLDYWHTGAPGLRWPAPESSAPR